MEVRWFSVECYLDGGSVVSINVNQYTLSLTKSSYCVKRCFYQCFLVLNSPWEASFELHGSVRI
jgi:hypothetical protein